MNQAFKQWQCFSFGFLDTETVVVTVWCHQTPDLTNTKLEKKVENLRSRSSSSKLPSQLSLSVLWLQNNTLTLSLDRHYFHPLLFFFLFSPRLGLSGDEMSYPDNAWERQMDEDISECACVCLRVSDTKRELGKQIIWSFFIFLALNSCLHSSKCLKGW